MRYTAVLPLTALCLLLAACSRNAAAPAEPQPFAPELEAIVEPLEVSEPEPAFPPAEEQEASAAAVERAPALVPEPGPESAREEYSAPASPLPENPAEPGFAPELLNAVALEHKLDRDMIEHELLRLINELRGEAGAEALGIVDEMRFAARIRSDEALASFTHKRPGGDPYNTAFDEAGFSYAGKWHGENLSLLEFGLGEYDENDIALYMFGELKSSPGNRRNMTNENYLQAGIGVSINRLGESVRVSSAQLFASL